MNRRTILIVAFGLLPLAQAGCGGAPQLGGDRDTFKAVDALYTAVSLRDASLLDQSAATLQGLRASGKLPEAASRALDGIVADARSGKWEPAFDRLSTFMQAQRR
jgi:hypothetical protein